MTDKLNHTPGKWVAKGSRVARSGTKMFICEVFRDSVATAIGNTALIALAPTAPHDCDDPQCLGNVNRRKLEAITEAASHLLVALLQVHPSDDQIIVDHVQDALKLLEGSDSVSARKLEAFEEMREALATMLPVYCDFLRGVGGDPKDSELVQQARAALAKAEQATCAIWQTEINA